MFSGKDNWSRDYEALVELGARIGIKIRERDEGAGPGNKTKYPRRIRKHPVQQNGSIKKMLTEYQQKLQALKSSVRQPPKGFTLTEYEINQRSSMVGELSDKYQQLSKSFTKGWTQTRYNSTGIDPWEGGGASQGPGSAHRMTVDQIRTEQQQLINEQDKGLDELSKALRRQQQMGLDMQDEIKEHNDLIDEIHGATSKTDERIKFQTRRVEEVRKKDSCKCTCALWTTIILLAIAIVVMIFVPINNRPY